MSPLTGLHGGVVVCGTTSGAGKSTVVAGLCRLLTRSGVRVAPFKAQNMSNHAWLTPDGAEIPHAQWAQAQAAGVPADERMAPILLKPGAGGRSHLLVLGRPAGDTGALDYGERTSTLRPIVARCLAELRARHDVVVAEGAGGAAEVNLLDRDLANLPLAAAAGLPALLVADVDRGGMLAAVVGTLALLPDRLRRCVRGVIVNRFRGDARLLAPGLRDLEARTGVPVLGVLPHLGGGLLDIEDSLDLEALHAQPCSHDVEVDVAVVAYPHLANPSDVAPLAAEPDVAVRLVRSARGLGRPDLVVLPGSRATVADLGWLRSRRLDEAIAASGAAVLAICAGYQMLGTTVDDAVESPQPVVTAGLGWLPVKTRFGHSKLQRWREGHALGEPITGFDMRHGRIERTAGEGWVTLDDEHGRHGEGATVADGRIRGTGLHGLLEQDGFRSALLADVAARSGRGRPPSGVRMTAVRRAYHDRLADTLAEHLDCDRLAGIIAAGAAT